MAPTLVKKHVNYLCYIITHVISNATFCTVIPTLFWQFKFAPRPISSLAIS